MRVTRLFAWVCALAVLAAAPRVRAESYAYQGQVQLQVPANDPCSVTAPTGSIPVTIYGRDDVPGLRNDGYLVSDRLVKAHISGNAISQLLMAYPGEASPSHVMRLRQLPDGSVTGTFDARTLVGALAGCGFVPATLSFTRTAVHVPDAIAQAAHLFDLDTQAVQAYVRGLHGQVKEAVPALQQALSEKERIVGAGQPQVLAYYFLLGNLQDAAGNYREEVPLFSKAVATCDKMDGAESVCSALMLISLGDAQVKTADYHGAEISIHHAQRISDQLAGREAPFSGALLNSLSTVLIYSGRYGEADTVLRQAVALNRKVAPHGLSLGVSLMNQGVLYRVTGQYAKSEAALREALAVNIQALGADSPVVILNTVNLSQVLRATHHYPEAEQLARKGLTAAEAVAGPERPDHPALGVAIVGLAEILRETNRNAEAEPLYRRALANAEKYEGPEHPKVALYCTLLASSLRATGRDDEALTLLKRAYRIAHVSQNQTATWRVPAELMALYGSGKKARPAVAIYYGKEAVNALQRIRGNLAAAGEEAQQAFLGADEVKSVYRTLANLLIAEQRLGEAQQVLAMLKEQEYYEYTDRGAPPKTDNTVAALSPAEKELDEVRSHDVSLGQEYGALQEKFKKDGQLNAKDHERLNALRKEMDAEQARFEERATAVANGAQDAEAQKRRGQQINDFSRAFQGTLKEMGHEAVLAQYFMLDDHVEILLTTPTTVLARQSPIGREALNGKIAAFRKTLSSPNQDPLAQSQELYGLLLKPIADDLKQAGAKTLMLSLDDTLRYLPFAALHDDQGYLIERVSVVMVNEAVRDKLAKPANDKWAVWGLGVTRGGADYPPLPYVGDELNAITGPQGILTGKVLLDNKFDEGSLRDGLDQGYSIIHIASHFQFTPGSMDDSFLLLGDGSRLTLAQIKTRLNFNSVELLTLSACETAVGDAGIAHHGVEVEGLGAIAQQAGAKAVLATLWPVADSSTALLMRTLYQAHKSDRADKADALRVAQLGLLHGTVQASGDLKGARGLTRQVAATGPATFTADPKAPFAHPYFWAPFILMGNWQ